MRDFRVVGAVALALLTGCGGGGGGGPVPTPSSAPGGGRADVYFSIVVPAGPPASNGLRRPNYVSSNTQSLSVSVNGGSAQVFGLTPSSNPNCSTSGSATVCSNLHAVAPPGTDTFVFTLYQQATPLPPTPTVLSIASVNNQVVQLGVNNQLGTFTLNPVIGSVAFSITAPGGGFQPGTPSSGNALNFTVKDPSGATIIAPGIYVDSTDTALPIALTSTQSAFTFSVDSGASAATGSLNGPSDTATLGYSGASVASTTTIKAAAGGISATQTIAALTAPIVVNLSSSASGNDYHITTAPPELDFYGTGISGTAALSESGYAGSFTLQSTTCGTWLSFSPTVGQTSTSFTANALAAGTTGTPAICTATFGDTNGQTITVTFTVTTISFGLQ
jgi:hypothetical protein